MLKSVLACVLSVFLAISTFDPALIAEKMHFENYIFEPFNREFSTD